MRILFVLLFAFASTPAFALTFASAHPDLYFRGKALHEIEQGRTGEAIDSFRTSARYGDKTSQLALALMHRDGIGVERDLALAYAWADLAAERGYPDFVAIRENLWHALDEKQRRDAQRRGAALYAEFGDDVAKPRLEALLVRGRLGRTGTRTDADTPVGMADFSRFEAIGTAEYFKGPMPRPVGSSLNGEAFLPSARNVARDYWAPENWEPEAYWAERDRLHQANAVVTVGALVKDAK